MHRDRGHVLRFFLFHMFLHHTLKEHKVHTCSIFSDDFSLLLQKPQTKTAHDEAQYVGGHLLLDCSFSSYIVHVLLSYTTHSSAWLPPPTFVQTLHESFHQPQHGMLTVKESWPALQPKYSLFKQGCNMNEHCFMQFFYQQHVHPHRCRCWYG